jgi:hypothetical protein
VVRARREPEPDRDENATAHVPVSSLLREELAQVERAIGHQVYMAEREERLLLYVARANEVAPVSRPCRASECGNAPVPVAG